MEALIKDIRYGGRTLLKHPSFTLIAVLTLALGIGANTAVFSLLHAVLVRPLPFHEPDQLVQVYEDASAIGFPRGDVAGGNYHDWKRDQTVFTDMAALGMRSFSLTGDGEPERVLAYSVTDNFIPLLGVSPLVGRAFNAEDDKPGAQKVALLTYGIWQRRYAGATDVINRDVLLDGEKYKVVGVLPESFQYLSDAIGLWVPMAFTSEQLADHGNSNYSVVARLKPGVSVTQAAAELQTISQRIARDNPETAQGLKSVVEPLKDEILLDVRRPLLMLGAGALLVLLITCANIASLQLSRATTRVQEMAVRSALGASRAQIIRQLLIESILLSLAGGIVGLIVALWSFTILKQLIPSGLTLSTKLTIDLNVFGFAVIISLVTGILFGLAPALQASRVELGEALKQATGRATSNLAANRLRGAFVVGQLALAVVLLICAGLMIQTIRNMLNQYSFFEPEKILTLRTLMPDSKFRDLEAYQTKEHPKRIAFLEQVLARVSALPGVNGVGYTTAVPLNWKGGANGVEIETRQNEEGRNPNAIHRQVSDGYFQTLGVRLVAGRFFEGSDRVESPPVAIINESLAREWRGADPIGKRFKLGTPNAPWITVVGIVADVRQMGMDVPVKSEMYVPYRQIKTHPWFGPRDLVIRTDGNPAELVASVRREIHAVDPTQAISHVRTMEELLVRETGSRRIGMILLTSFAGLAVLLAALGIYGVLSFFVAQHTREIGVRMALGAQLRDVMSLVLRKGLLWTVTGIAIGLISAFALSRLLASLLFEVSATDPATFIGVAVCLFGVALVACYLPARRATKVDPLIALRYE